MALERRDPVPPGTYSIFVNESERPTWESWLREHRSTVRQLATIEKRGVGGSELTAIFHTDPDGNIIWKTVGSSNYFQVSAPTPWVGLGLPTIEDRPISAWAREENENPEYQPEPTALDDLRDIVLLGGGIYLAGILIAKAIK